MLIIAHRGASGHFPENTLCAFRGALECGADMCELDVHLTRDGALAVIHDDTADRTTDGIGPVKAMTLAELKRLDAGGRFPQFKGERVPTLDEVFSLLRGRCALNIELKAPEVETRVCACVGVYDAFDTAIVSSFDWAALARVKDIDGRIRIGLLAKRGATRMLSAAVAMGADAIHPRVDFVNQALCGAAHERNLEVHAWTADDPALIARLIACGVDGIMTNYPERLRALVGR
ncbi:MAG: glycerophosphodiester phosphodiesterase [Candidatus Binataceae bacterium]